ncbi:MAG TPA: HEAT repeat domain-containing protein [Planctomycetota bacterium]|nr:HEAT repeat domain-containing protein [Planctomycetota bacterium]
MKTPVLCGLAVLVAIAATILLNPPQTTKPRPEPRPQPVPRRRVASLPKKREALPPARKASEAEKKKEDELLDEAAAKDATDEERQRALEELEAQLLEEQQVERLAEIAGNREMARDVRRAALETLVEVASLGHDLARLRALEIFARIQADAQEERSIADLMVDPSPDVRTRVAAALGDVEPEGQDNALETLERAFANEQEPMVQEAIAEAIVRAGGERAGPILDRLAQGASEGTARMLAQHRPQATPQQATPPAPPPEGQ